MDKFTLSIIGAGNMASAIVGGILKKQILKPNQIAISDKDNTKLQVFKEKGLFTTNDNTLLATNSENLLFAVKPQIAPIVFDEIKNIINVDTVISIMAGISISKLKANLGNRNYVRVMPNTPALIGHGMAAVAFSDGFSSDFIMSIFESFGKAVKLDEKYFDAVTSLSGSGPAYVYMFIKALIDGGIQNGLDAEVSKELALQTVIGATEMIRESDKPIDDLIDAVCSKGGTTIQAVDCYRENNLEGIVKEGMVKCFNRSKELGK